MSYCLRDLFSIEMGERRGRRNRVYIRREAYLHPRHALEACPDFAAGKGPYKVLLPIYPNEGGDKYIDNTHHRHCILIHTISYIEIKYTQERQCRQDC